MRGDLNRVRVGSALGRGSAWCKNAGKPQSGILAGGPLTSVFRQTVRARADVALTCTLLLVLGCVAAGLPKLYADVDVYRLGALTFLDGKSIYHQLPVS